MQMNSNSRKTGLDNFSGQYFFDEQAMFIYDYRTLEILDANKSAISLYGFEKSEFIGLKISELGEKISDAKINQEGISKKSSSKPIWKHKRRDGETFFVQITTQRLHYHEKSAVLAIVHETGDFNNAAEAINEALPVKNENRTSKPFGLLEWNRSFQLRSFSRKAEAIFNYSYEDVVNKSPSELPFIDNSLVNRFNEQVQKAEEGHNGYFTLHTEHADEIGEKVYCRWHNLVVLDEQGRFLCIYSLVEKTASRQSAGHVQQPAESKFRVMSEQSFVGIYILEGTAFVYVNPRMCEITGYSEEELEHDIPFKDLIHPDDFARFNLQRKQWESNPTEPFEISLRITSKNGNVLHVKTFISAIDNKEKLKLLGVVVDQTRQVKALEKYRASVQSYISLFDSIPDGIYIHDKDGTFIEVNKGVEKMYGYKKEEVIGKSPSFLAAAGKVDMEQTMELFQEALKGNTQKFRWWGKRKNGEIFPKEVKLTKGNYFGERVVIAVARDITESVKREDELRRNEELFEQLFSNSPLAIALLNKDSQILQVNDSFESLFGYQLTEIKGENLDALIVPDEDLETAISLSDSKETFTLSKRRKTKSGESIDVFIYGVPVVVEDETIAIFGIYMDITDRIEAEKRVKQSLDEKEILLAEIHHRVKNNLAVITGLLELQYHNLKSEEAKSALRDSQMRINSMGMIHEKLYQNESLSEIEFGQYIHELVEVIIKSQNKSNKVIDLQIESDLIKLPIAKAIPCGLIINEIVTNSLKYAFSDDHARPVIRIELKKLNGEAQIHVSDNGIGLPVPFDKIEKDSLGTLLIKTLSSQLKADMEVNGTDGTSYKLIFSLQ